MEKYAKGENAEPVNIFHKMPKTFDGIVFLLQSFVSFSHILHGSFADNEFRKMRYSVCVEL